MTGQNKQSVRKNVRNHKNPKIVIKYNRYVIFSDQNSPSTTEKPFTHHASTIQHIQTKTTTFIPTTKRPTTFHSTVTTRRTTTRNPTTPTQSTCTNGQYYPHEECNSFYVCVNGQLVSQRCAPGLQWNVDDAMCDWGYKIKCLGRRKHGQMPQKIITGIIYLLSRQTTSFRSFTETLANVEVRNISI